MLREKKKKLTAPWARLGTIFLCCGFIYNNMDSTTNEPSDICRHLGRQDQPFSGDGLGYEASHNNPAEHQKVNETYIFRPRTSLPPSPPGLRKFQTTQQIQVSNDDNLSSDEGTREERRSPGFLQRRHSSPEVPPKDLPVTKGPGTKRTLESPQHFSSPSLIGTRSVRERRATLEGSTEELQPALKKPRKRMEPKNPGLAESKEASREKTLSFRTEAAKIQKNLKSYIGVPERNYSKTSQDHVNKKISRLIEIIELLCCDVEATGELPDLQKPRVRKDQDEDMANMVDSVIARVMPTIMATLEKIEFSLISRVNRDINHPGTSYADRCYSSQKKSGLPGKEDPSTSRVVHLPESQNLVPSQSASPSLIPTQDNEAPWTNVVNRRRRRPTGSRMTSTGDVLKLIPPAEECSTEEKKQKTSVVSVDVSADNCQLSPNSKAAKIIEEMENFDTSSFGKDIVGIKIAKDGRVMIRTKDQETAAKLVAGMEKPSANSTLRYRVLSPRLPRVVVAGVPQAWDEGKVVEVIKTSLTRRNSSGAPTCHVRPLFRRGPKNLPSVQWVVEVDRDSRASLLKSPIRHGILSLTTQDFIEQPRCFQCQRHGHIARNCKENVPTCGWCAESGHKFSECPRKSKPPRCANCQATGRNSRHPTDFNACPTRLAFLASRILTTGYG